MIKEIQDMGIVVVVSIWPTVEVKSENYQHMLENNMLVKQDRGFPCGLDFPDNEKTVFFDATNPDTRKFVWKQVKKNYWDKGIRSFWLGTPPPILTVH
jgi:alpha-D-xyloside xylohydrolase